MSWGESPADFTGEPRKVFINFLIWNMKQIESILYFGKQSMLAIRPIQGLIDSLDKQSKKKLQKEYEALMKISRGEYVAYGNGDVEAIYSKVSNYLHEAFLKEVRFATPRHGSGKIGVPNR